LTVYEYTVDGRNGGLVGSIAVNSHPSTVIWEY